MSNPLPRRHRLQVKIEGPYPERVTRQMMEDLNKLGHDLSNNVLTECNTRYKTIPISEVKHGYRPRLKINFYSCPVDPSVDFPKRHPAVYGIENLEEDFQTVPSSDTLLTIYDDSSIPVAEFGPRDLYILVNLLRIDNREIRSTVFSRILADYLDYRYHLRTDKIDLFKQKIIERQRSGWKKNFEKAYLGQIGEAIQEAEENLDEIEAEIIKSRSNLLQKTGERSCVLGQLNGMRQVIEKHNPTKIAEEYDKLSALSTDGVVIAKDGHFSVSIGQIDIEKDGVVYDIGEFDIEIYPNGDYGGVRCFNSTRNIEEEYHPHISSNGTICFGSIEESIVALISQMEYSIVVQVMIDFLRTYNDNDCYEDVTSWPVKGAPSEESNS